VVGEALSGRRHPLVRFIATFTVLMGLALAAFAVFVVAKAWPLVLAATVTWVTIRQVRRHRRRTVGTLVSIVPEGRP
jgi:hypothetical protein